MDGVLYLMLIIRLDAYDMVQLQASSDLSLNLDMLRYSACTLQVAFYPHQIQELCCKYVMDILQLGEMDFFEKPFQVEIEDNLG
jgi:hypothetical protein